MLKNNAFTTDNMGQMSTGNNQANTFDSDKYVNDYRLLDIRCGVLEEERTDHIMQL